MTRLWIPILLAWGVVTPAQADYDSGMVEFQQGHYASALYEWRGDAEKGDARSQFAIGRLYEQGIGTSVNLANAQKWYGMAADSGFADAQVRLGELYLTGKLAGGMSDAAELFRQAAEQGNVHAQFQLGMLYLEGKGVDKDERKAAGWIEKAAQQGNVQAQNNIGNLYEKGRGVKQDETRAFEWYQKAAEQGDAYAQNNLGAMYARGKGVKRNNAWAVFWFTAATKRGNALAADNIPSVLSRLVKKQITGSRINIRRGAGTEYEVVASLNRDQSVYVLGEMNGWSQIYFSRDGSHELGWALTKLL